MLKPGVVILGGGVAGIAAALPLRDAGYPVTLVEARAFLGGRAFAFPDAASGQRVDNGQHFIVGRCHCFLNLLERLGVRDKWHLQSRLNIPVIDRAGKTARLRAWPLPKPWHLLLPFLGYGHLSFGERISALSAMAAARRIDRQSPEREKITFYTWLRQRRQSERAIRNLWNLLIEPTLNDKAQAASAAMGLMIVQEGLLRERNGANVGYPQTDLQSALGKPARQALEQAGVRLLLGRPARRLMVKDGIIDRVELADGQQLTGQVFINALPYDILLNLLPPEIRSGDYFRNLAGLEGSPIVNLHLWYDRPVMELDFCAFIDRPLQWVFNKSRMLGLPGPGQYLCISLSAAWEYIDQSADELARQMAAELAAAFPAAKTARLEQVRVVKQRTATFRCLPGAAARRPGPATPLPNLFLAGEWTDTGWPSTLESAARSGALAAERAAQILAEVSR